MRKNINCEVYHVSGNWIPSGVRCEIDQVNYKGWIGRCQMETIICKLPATNMSFSQCTMHNVIKDYTLQSVHVQMCSAVYELQKL